MEDMTQPEVGQLGVRVLVLPIGSTEPHANHMSYGTDFWTAHEIAARAATRANELGGHVLVLPPMPYGVNTNLMPIPFAQSIRSETMMRFVKDVVETAAGQGIRKIVIVNGHGGNATTLGAVLRDLAADHPKVFVALVETWEGGDAAKIIEKPGEHADEAETSVGLALFPDKIHMDRAVPPRNPPFALKSLGTSNVTFVRPWQHVSNNTGLGDPTQATKEKGEKIVATVVARMSAFLKELSDVEMTDTFPY